MKRTHSATLLTAAACLVGASARAEPLPDFSAPDVNTSSNRRGEEVSPRDYRLQISAYYFGHST